MKAQTYKKSGVQTLAKALDRRAYFLTFAIMQTAEAKLLLIETSTPVASVVLSHGLESVASLTMNVDKGHARLVAPMIQQCLTNVQWSIHDLDGIVVSAGPGSYTGLRVGVSTAKGIALAAQLPLLSINSLQGLAGSVLSITQTLQANIIPMTDARRMEVYLARFDQQGQEISPTEAVIIEEGSLSDWLNAGPHLFVGDGVEKCREIFSKHPNAILLPEFRHNATGMIRLAIEKFQRQEFEDLEAFEPYYLKSVRITKPRNRLF